MFPRSLSFRLAAGAVVWIAVALAVTGFALTEMFRDTIERNFDDILRDDLDEIVSLIEVDPEGRPHLRHHPVDPRFNKRFSGWYWRILADNGWREWSQSLWDQEITLPKSGISATSEPVIYTAFGPAGEALRVAAFDYAPGDSKTRTLILVAGPNYKIKESMATFVKVVVLALAVLGVGLVVAVAVQVRFGLKPLRRLVGRLHDVGAGRATRLEGANPSELAPLASELNALLDHNASVIERVRTQAGELAHAIKTSLAVLRNEADRIDGEAGEIVRYHTELMSQRVGANLSRAQAAGARGVLGARTPVGPVARDLCRTLERIFTDRAIRITLDIDNGAVFQGECQDMEEMLGNLLENACKWAHGQVRVRAGQVDGYMELVVEDDGPGIPMAAKDGVLERGRRLDKSMPGNGLGLTIVHDVVDLYGGSLTLEDSPLGGLAAKLRLPSAG